MAFKGNDKGDEPQPTQTAKNVTFGDKENATAVVYAAKAATYTAPIVLAKKDADASKVAVATVELTGATATA